MADDRNDSASLPSAFADAPDPEPTEQRTTKPSSNESSKAADTSKRPETGLKSSGVPTARLLGWAVPVLGVVAGVAMYNQSPAMAAGVFAVAFFVAFLMLIGHLIRRRNANSAGSRGGSSGGRGGGTSSPRAKRQWLPWSRRSGGSGGSGGGSRGGRSTGSNSSAGGGRGSGGLRGLFHRGGSGRGGSSGGASGRSSGGRKSPNGGGAGTKQAGSSSASGSGGTKRNWNPLRRNRTATAGTGSPAGTKSTTSSHHAAGSTGRPTGSGGSRGGGIRNALRRRNPSPTSPKGPKGSKSSATTPATGKSSTASSGTTGSGRSIRHPFRRTPNGSKPAGGGTAGRTGDHGKTRGKDSGSVPQPAANSAKGDTKREQQQRWRPWRRKGQEATTIARADAPAAEKTPKKKERSDRGKEKQENRTYGAEAGSAAQRKADAWKRKQTEKTLKELGPIDDMGFPLVDTSKVKTSEKAPLRKVVDSSPSEFDDCGFPIYSKVTPITKNKEHTVAVNTSQYTSMIDLSTPQTTKATLSSAATTARLDASRKTEEASDFRRSAANLAGIKGMAAEAENLLSEAAAMEQDADARLGMAAGFENQASQVSA